MPAPIHLTRLTIPVSRGDSRRQCPIGGCTILVPPSKLMHLDHWRMVPKRLQDAVYAAYDHGAGIGSEELAMAQDAAIQAVEAKLARQA